MTERRERLGRLLAGYRPAGSAEAADRAAMQALLVGAGDPFSRSHFVPGHFTSSGFVLAPEADAVLLVLHRKLGRWLQPGGHVDYADADLVMAARREIEEEAGLDRLEQVGSGIFDLDAHAIPPHGREPAHTHFDVRFLFRAATTDLAPSPEVETAAWVALSDVEGVTSDGSVRRAVAKLARYLA